jgi:prepilin peptidase CpaA
MPDLNFQITLFLLFVGAFTAIAAYTDWKSRRIPNKLTLPMFFLGWIYQLSFNGFSGMGDAAIGFLIGFGTLFVLWMIGGGGGGDVKLMGALSVWLGYHLTLTVMILSIGFVIVGTLLVLAWSLIASGPFATKRKYVAESEKGKAKKVETITERKQRRVMAYAIPVALATWAVLIREFTTL